MLHLQENGPLPLNPGKSIELFLQAACKWRRYARSIEYRQKIKKTTLIELVD